jgi:hypothetical protein
MLVAAEIVFMLGLCGCAGGIISDGLTALEGQPVDAAIDYLGLPSAELTVANRKVVVWSLNFTALLPQTSVGNYSGQVGGQPTSGSTVSTGLVAVPTGCTIRLGLDDQDLINYWEVEGTQGGCESYASRLAPLAKETRNKARTKAE